jgi:hypothetical protein
MARKKIKDLKQEIKQLPLLKKPDITSTPASVKRCEGCGKTFPLRDDFFHRDPSSVDGFRSECKVCRNGMLTAKAKTTAEKEVEKRKEAADLKLIKIIEDTPQVNEVDDLPHTTLLYQRLNSYFGGADGWARHMALLYLTGGPAIRSRVLFKIAELGVKVSEDGHARVPVDLMTTEDLERELEKRIKAITPKITKPAKKPKLIHQEPEGEAHAEP